MSQNYTPNHISSRERTLSLLFSIGLLAYGTIGLFIDDIYIPGKRSRGIHFHGIPCWVMYLSILCAVLNFLSVIVDHYDTRNNETNYQRFAHVTRILGWIFFGFAVILDLFFFKN